MRLLLASPCPSPGERHEEPAPRRAAPSRLALLCAGLALWAFTGTPGAAAESPAVKAPTVPAAPAAAPAAADAQGELAAFLREYDRALAAGDRRYLAAHTAFPLPFAEAEYNMEAKATKRQLTSVDALLKARQRLRWPKALVPESGQALSGLRVGAEKCEDKAHGDVPDPQKGAPAVKLDGDAATLSYLAEPCSSDSHIVTLRFERKDKVWRLKGRAVRMGVE